MATDETLSDADFAPAQTTLSDSDFASESVPTVTPPPTPQATTHLSDRNLTVGHPMDMSHDQVNDAIQTQIYGRPRNDFHEDAPPVDNSTWSKFKNILVGEVPDFKPEVLGKTVGEVSKAGLRGVEGAAKGVAGLVKWFGDVLPYGVDEKGKALPKNEYVEKVAGHIRNFGQQAVDYWSDAEGTGIAKADPEIFRGSFVSNPSFTRLAARVAEGLPMLGAASVVTLASGNPLAGAGVLGLVGAGEQYATSKEEGSSTARASAAGVASGIGNTLLMSLPMGKYLEGFGKTTGESIVRGAAEFAGISGVMTPFNNIVSKIGGDKSKQLFDGMAESILSGAVSGGVLGAFSPGRGAEIDSMIQEAHKAGVPAKDIDAARAEIAKQLVENPEAVTGAIKQSKVYNDIKDQLSKVEKPDSMTPEQWAEHNESTAQLWSSRVASEAQKRGESVDVAYERMRPTIVDETAINQPAEKQTQLFQRSPEGPALEEKALKEFGEAKNMSQAGFILPDGRMVDFTRGGDMKLYEHRDIAEIYKGSGQIDEPTNLLHDFMEKTGAVRLTDYKDIGNSHLSISAHGPLSSDQLKNIGDHLITNPMSNMTLERVDQFGKHLKSQTFDNPTGEDVARFFNGSSTYFQKNENGPRGASSFTPQKTVIKLFKNADASTFLHESAHVWLQDIHDFVKSGKADEKYLSDWKQVSDWLGVKEGAKNLSTDQHEKFARAFESYARNGIAPVPQLQNAFDKFKDWLSHVYRSAQDLKVEIPENVKAVLDDMFVGDESGNQYVKNKPFDIEMRANDKLTARDLREQFSGLKNEQIVRGNQLAEEIKQMVPSLEERQGMFWYKAAHGDMNILAEALNDPKLQGYHDQILSAMKLSPNAVEALGKVAQYYDEAGRVSQEVGTIKSIRENYQNRIYAPDKPQDFVKTETKSGIKQSTKHALRRVFDTEFDAAQAGKKFATTDIADSLSIHNEELARVNTARKLADAMSDAGLGAWKREVPDGWEKVGTLEKRVPIKDKEGKAVVGEDGNQVVSSSSFVAPKGIAKGLAAISDPNFAKKIDSVRELQRYQGLVKTVDLSFSFFHHFSMAMQTVYQGGLKTLMNLNTMSEHLNTPEFKELEQDFVQHTGITAKVEANQDILRNLVQHNEDHFSKVSNLPVVRNILHSAEKSSTFLFGKLQRFLKVSDYGEQLSNWVADHPDAKNAEVKSAKVGIAKQVNAVFGGLNWEAMGMTKSNLSLLRLGLLAPDWTISNIQLLQNAFGDKGVAGQASRAHILRALVVGMTLTEGINKLLTGHFTDENKPGHKLEVEISPDVYISFLRGGIGDIMKFGSMVSESGLQGVSRFAQGKLAPFPRTAVGLLTNTQYTGRPIGKKSEGPVVNTYEVLKYLMSSLAPMPLGLSNFLQMGKDEKITPQGAAAVLTGVGRYSKSSSSGSKLKV